MYLRKKMVNQKIALCLGDGCGLGNLLQALPAAQALYEMGNTSDLFLSGFMYRDIPAIVSGQPYVRTIYENTYDNSEVLYDLCIVSFLSDHRVANAKRYLKLKRDWKKRSEYEQYCWAAGKLGARGFKPPRLNIAERDFELKPCSIVIHAGCTQRQYWERRKWTRYAELAEVLTGEGFHMYCCGKRDEKIDHPRVTAFTDLPIQETAALINQCDLFLSNDSGLMHLAAALQKKQIAIFTATSDKKSGPYYNPRARVITPRLACYPCYGKDEAWDRCNDWICRDAISVAQVYDVIKKVMDEHG